MSTREISLSGKSKGVVVGSTEPRPGFEQTYQLGKELGHGSFSTVREGTHKVCVSLGVGSRTKRCIACCVVNHTAACFNMLLGRCFRVCTTATPPPAAAAGVHVCRGGGTSVYLQCLLKLNSLSRREGIGCGGGVLSIHTRVSWTKCLLGVVTIIV